MAALAGRTALVTGASRGIGLAVARALAADGARVVLLARHRPALEAAVQAIDQDARRRHAAGSPAEGSGSAAAIAIPCDLSQARDVDAALALLERSIGTPDILVSNAGAFALGAVGAMPPDEAEQLLHLNLVAPYRLLHALVPPMRARGSGHLVTIGSVADRHAFPENAAYAASKFGARAMHEVLRHELRGSGVRVSLISPGPVNTAIWDPIGPELRDGFPTRAQMLAPDAVANAVLWAITRPAGVNIDELRLSRA